MPGYGVYMWAASGHTFEVRQQHHRRRALCMHSPLALLVVVCTLAMQGEWSLGLPLYGCMTTSTYTYDGDWVDNLPHGQGETEFSNGS